MKRILNGEQMKQIDQATLRTQQIGSLELMARASQAVVNALWQDEKDLSNQELIIFCGKGNNGGDGLMIAKLLQERGVKVRVYLLTSEQYSADNLESQAALENMEYFSLQDKLKLEQADLLIDCLFGYGLYAQLDKEWTGIIAQINKAPGKRISVDMPSGLPCEGDISQDAAVIKADMVYSFEVPKLNLLLPEYAAYVAAFKLLDIGLDQAEMKNRSGDLYYVEEMDARSLVVPRSRFSHKGTYGHACIIGGSVGKMGATILASKAALRAGCGLVTVLVPTSGRDILQVANPEAMLLLDAADEHLRDFQVPDHFHAIAAGIGMGNNEETERGFGIWLQTLSEEQALVLDADALNILSANPHWLKDLPKGTILSPHPKELRRLIGDWETDAEKLEKVKALARAHKLLILVKGANTAIVNDDGKIYFNSTGNPGLATAGTGDVLTGILCGLRAKGLNPLDAAILGVYLHGLAADLAVKECSEEGLIAGDVIQYLPKAWKALQT